MTRTTHLSPLFRFASLRDLLDLLAMLRDFREPLGSPEGLRRAIDLLLKAAECRKAASSMTSSFVAS